jgi:hypothetical protein
LAGPPVYQKKVQAMSREALSRRILQALLGCTLCLGLGTSGAEALTITSGGFSLFNDDSIGGASGDGFSIFYFNFAGIGDGRNQVQVLNFTNPDPFTCCGGAITVGSDTCTWGAPPTGLNCGFLALISSAAIPPNPTPGEPFTTDPIHFVAAGHLNVGPGYDVFGAGSVIGTYCTDPECFFRSSPNLIYTFSAPWPPTFLLFLTGFGLLTLRISMIAL